MCYLYWVDLWTSPQSNKFFNKNKINRREICRSRNGLNTHRNRFVETEKRWWNLNISENRKKEAEKPKRIGWVTYSMDSHTNGSLSSDGAASAKRRNNVRRRWDGKYANILNPSNSETSKRAKTKERKFTVSHQPSKTYPQASEAFPGEIFICKIFSANIFFRCFQFSPIISPKKTQTVEVLKIVYFKSWKPP